MAGIDRKYTDEQLKGDGVSKKDLVTFLQESASLDFQKERKLKGSVKNVAKTRTKDDLLKAYNDMFETKAFKKEGEDQAAAEAKAAAELARETEALHLTEEKANKAAANVDKPAQEVKYKKVVTRKGDGQTFPNKGDKVSCFYVGKLEDGTEFDQNVRPPRRGKAPQPLRFKVGNGNVIRGWDEALLTMSTGEKAELIIEPEWAYGRKGLEPKIPPNSRLLFEVELVGVEG